MTENTPTPATRCDSPECPGVAQDRHEIESGPELHDLCKRVLSLTAERDALAAILAEAPHADACALAMTFWGKECRCYRSKLPADALAADRPTLEQVLAEHEGPFNYGTDVEPLWRCSCSEPRPWGVGRNAWHHAHLAEQLRAAGVAL